MQAVNGRRFRDGTTEGDGSVLEINEKGRRGVEGCLQVSERKNREIPSRQITETA
jgi:hypothetical protein